MTNFITYENSTINLETIIKELKDENLINENLIVDYMDKRIQELDKLRAELKAQYNDLFPSTGKDGAEIAKR